MMIVEIASKQVINTKSISKIQNTIPIHWSCLNQSRCIMQNYQILKTVIVH